MYVGIDLGKRIVACTLLKADGTEVLTTMGPSVVDHGHRTGELSSTGNGNCHCHMEQTIDKSGRLVLPKALREAVGLTPGTIAEIRVVESGLLVTRKGVRAGKRAFLDGIDALRKRHRVRLSKQEILELGERALEDL